VQQPLVVELFARELVPGVLSFGDEAVKFNELGPYMRLRDPEQ
jgi:hypothetical protein